MNNNLKEMRRTIMVKAHAMCKQMREQGYEFDYHTQLGLNIKYLWETVGETIDALETNDEIAEDTNEATESMVEDITEDTNEEYDTDECKLGKEFEQHECTEAYCGTCMMETLQYREGGEFVCTECGEKWELLQCDPYPILNKFIQLEDEESEEEIMPIEYVSHIALPNNNGYSFLFRVPCEDKDIEFTAVASRNHRLPIVYDADPNDIDLLERVKGMINEKTHIYDSLENDYVPDYRYHRGEDYFIYFDEQAEIFKGYYCGNDVYGGRAFVFDINNQEGPCSRALRQLIKDHKAGQFGAYTSMKGKGTTITKWREKILNECRQLWKLSKNMSKINEAKCVIDKPWTTTEQRFNAAIRFLTQMNIEHECKYESYDAAVDAELRHIAEVRAKGNDRYGRDTVKTFQDRIHELQLTNLYEQQQVNKTIQNDIPDEWAELEL